MSRPERAGRSVLDYETEDELRKALMVFGLNEQDDEEMSAAETVSSGEGMYDSSLDWVLPLVDPKTTEAQSMKQEIRRLQVLKSYEILDSEKDEVFERITGMAARIFKVPAALISLIDLGRQWFLSNRGFGEATQTERKISFCSHAILSKSNVLVVLDATQDFRFKNNPLVAGEPFLRFYAGAALISPEGYKLGSLCLVDFVPRAFTKDDEATLVDLAQLVIDAMVSRKREKERGGNIAQLVACTAQDLLTPLSGVQLSLSMLANDDDMKAKLSFQQAELLSTASTCSDLMIRLCKSATEAIEDGDNFDLDLDSEILQNGSSDILPVTKIDGLVKSLRMLTEPIPKQVPLVIKVDPSVPPLILCDDLKLFRLALNLLSSAIHRTQRGGVELRLSPTVSGTDLLFECHDTAEDIPVDDYQYLFKPCRREDGSLRMCLSSVASLVASLDGECGFRPRVDKSSQTPSGSNGHETGSLFWFRVPLFAPDSLGAAGLHLPRKNSEQPFGLASRVTPASCFASSNSLSATDGRAADSFRECKMKSFGHDHNASNGFHDHVSKDASHVIAQQQPSRDMNMQATDDIPSSIAGQRIRTALVIDDSPMIRKSLSIALSKVGFQVNQAGNGWEGLELLKGSVFDFVLCDVLMPIVDGLECVREYRTWEQTHRPTMKQVIVGMSAHATADAVSEGLRAGMDDFRAKPITITNLAEIYEGSDVVSLAKVLDTAFQGEIQTDGSMNFSGDLTEATEGNGSVQRKRDTDDDCSVSSISEVDPDYGNKRQRTGCLFSSTSAPQRVCLVASDRPSTTTVNAFRQLKRSGWKIVVVHEGKDALRMLQMRNWDLVLIDNDLEGIVNTQSIPLFRQWERENRASRQRNLVLVSDMDIPSPDDTHAIVQAPTGYNNVIRKPVAWKDLRYLLKTGRPVDAMLGVAAETPTAL